MGRPAYFIRTFGCPVKCPWCDSAGTWHPDWIPESVDRISELELANRAALTKAEFAVITGGEPAIHDLSDLTEELSARHIPSHLETSGAFVLNGNFSWITLSPKWAKLPLPMNLESANEIKIIVEEPRSIELWWAKLSRHVTNQIVWLHPEWSKRNDPLILESISRAVKDTGKPFRAGYQLHRLYNVDALDSNSRPNVPLGGDLTLGY